MERTGVFTSKCEENTWHHYRIKHKWWQTLEPQMRVITKYISMLFVKTNNFFKIWTIPCLPNQIQFFLGMSQYTAFLPQPFTWSFWLYPLVYLIFLFLTKEFLVEDLQLSSSSNFPNRPIIIHSFTFLPNVFLNKQQASLFNRKDQNPHMLKYSPSNAKTVNYMRSAARNPITGKKI